MQNGEYIEPGVLEMNNINSRYACRIKVREPLSPIFPLDHYNLVFLSSSSQEPSLPYTVCTLSVSFWQHHPFLSTLSPLVFLVLSLFLEIIINKSVS